MKVEMWKSDRGFIVLSEPGSLDSGANKLACYTFFGTVSLEVETPKKKRTVYKILFATNMFPKQVMISEVYYESAEQFRSTNDVSFSRIIPETAKEV
jgi:hypothetical protein